MSGILSHPRLSNDFQREIAVAASPDSELKAKANPAFTWLVANNADKLLFKSVEQCTHFKPTPGFIMKPSHWTSPPPGGPDQSIGIVIGLDSKGKLRACASNALTKPTQSDSPCPATFFEQFDAAKSAAAQSKLLGEAVCSAAKEQMDWVERICKEGQRYRTSPIFLVVLGGDKQHFYATTVLVEGPQQTDRTLEWTGRLAA